MNPLSKVHAAIVMIYLGTLLGSRDLSAHELPDVPNRVQASSISVVVEKTHTVLQTPERRDKGAEATKSNLRYGTGMVFSAKGYLLGAGGDRCSVGAGHWLGIVRGEPHR